MKKTVSLALSILLVLSMLLTMASCAPSVEKIEDVLDDWEDDEKIMYEKASRDDREEFLDECIIEMSKELDIDIDIDGDLEDVFYVEDEDDNVFYIIVFESLSDAKQVGKIDLDDIDDDDIQEFFDETDFVIIRKGKIVFCGNEDLIKDFLDEL